MNLPITSSCTSQCCPFLFFPSQSYQSSSPQRKSKQRIINETNGSIKAIDNSTNLSSNIPFPHLVGYLCGLSTSTHNLHIFKALLLGNGLQSLQIVLGFLLQTIIEHNVMGIGYPSEIVCLAATGSLQIQNVQNEERIGRFHDVQDPVKASSCLDGKIHGNHPTHSLLHEQPRGSVKVGSYNSSILSSHLVVKYE